MKKSFLIIGLFSLMMVLTSFNTPADTGGKGNGGTSTDTGQFTSETGGKGNGGTSTDTGQFTTETGGKSNGGTCTDLGQ